MRSVILDHGLSYVDVYNLQKIEFQKRIEARRKGMPIPEDVIFFTEHKPVYTLGKHGKISNLLISADSLKKDNIEFVKINRGGDITYHGPGQLTVYPIIDLLNYHLGVKDYVYLLEQCVIDTIAEFGIMGERIEGKTGVWIRKSRAESVREGHYQPVLRKISALGIKCSRFFTMHGIALNVSSDLSGFKGIIPCGLPLGVTSISNEIGREVSVKEVIPILQKKLIYLLQPRIHAQEIS